MNVNSKAVLLGCKGIASPATISKLAEESVKQDLLGIMVWYVKQRSVFFGYLLIYLFIYLFMACICLQFAGMLLYKMDYNME